MLLIASPHISVCLFSCLFGFRPRTNLSRILFLTHLMAISSPLYLTALMTHAVLHLLLTHPFADSLNLRPRTDGISSTPHLANRSLRIPITFLSPHTFHAPRLRFLLDTFAPRLLTPPHHAPSRIASLCSFCVVTLRSRVHMLPSHRIASLLFTSFCSLLRDLCAIHC